MKYFVLSLSAVLLLMFACNKKAPKATDTNENILRTGKWKISGGTVTYKLPSGKDTSIQAASNMAACHQDDYLVFDSLFNAVIYSGSVKCSPADPDSVSFKWSLFNDGNGISFYHPDGLVYLMHPVLQQYSIDTISNDPNNIVLDTISYLPLILDSIYAVQYANPVIFDTSVITGTFSNFTPSAFTVNYNVISNYADTVLNHRFGMPVIKTDTVRYSIQYTKF